MKLKPVGDQVVAVVGSASGIGRATALRFASRGARVVAADNEPEGLETLAAEVRSQGGAVTTVVAAVEKYSDMQAVAQRAVDEYGRLDTWAHVAAIDLYATFEQTTLEEFRRIIDVNLLGEINGAKAALPHLVQSGGGALIHVSSIEAKRSLPYNSAYAASKHGVDGFLEALRLELRHDRLPVSVTQIMPASINTPIFDKSRTKLGVKPIGVPPLYSPETVAQAIVHAAEHPSRDIIVGGAAKAMYAGQRLSPRALDEALLRTAFRAQKTSETRSADAPSNFEGPLGRRNQVSGEFGGLTFKHSLSTWLDLHPAVKGAALLGAAVAASRLLSQENSSRMAVGDMGRQRPAAVTGATR